MTRKSMKKKVGFTLEQAREVAAEHLYPESKHDEDNQVVCFQDGCVLIHVYYKTASVITCLNHPVRGKGQVFRRKLTLKNLEDIFEDPLAQMASGYYQRKHLTQQWKMANKNDTSSFMSDMARRWQYVAVSLDLIEGDAKTISTLKTVMNVVSELMWNPGTMPALHNCRDGARSIVAAIVLQVAEEDGAIGMCRTKEAAKFQIEGGPRPKLICCSENRETVMSFMEKNRSKASQALNLLKSLPTDLRKDVCQWLTGLLECGCSIVDENFEYIWKDEVIAAHREYSKTFYSKNQMGNMCYVHGILADDD